MSLWPSPWPAEDGGPRRSQAPSEVQGLGIRPDERLVTAAVRDAFATTMVVLREPGEVFALRHTLGRRPLRDPSTGWVERIDPITLAAVGRSPDLAAGPFWPGGIAAHANGSLHVVYGCFCHRLSAQIKLLASRRLPPPARAPLAAPAAAPARPPTPARAGGRGAPPVGRRRQPVRDRRAHRLP